MWFALVIFLLIGCGREEAVSERGFFIESVRDVGFVQCYADAFEDLALEEKILAFYLTRAAISGNPIIYQQTHPEALRVKRMLDGILSHSKGMKLRLLRSSEEYAKLFYANHGFYQRKTGAKIIPQFDKKMFQDALVVALSNGAKVGFRAHKDVKMNVNELDSLIFNPDYEPFYRGEFHSVDAIYRSGNDIVPPGQYAHELAGLADNLRLAEEYAGGGQKNLLKRLATYFETGNTAILRDYHRDWVKSDFKVDCALGFGQDESIHKEEQGDFYGLVFIRDEEKQRLYDDVIEKIPYFTSTIPLKESCNLEDIIPPKITAAQLVTATGGVGFLTPDEICLPAKENVRGKVKFKKVVFTNVIDARWRLRMEKSLLFASTEAEKSLALKYGGEAEWTLRVMKDIFGQIHLNQRQETSALSRADRLIMDNAIAELAALWNMSDEKIPEWGFISNPEAVAAGYQLWLRNFLMTTASAGENGTFSSPNHKAQQIIAKYLTAETNAVSQTQVGGKTYFVLGNSNEMREAVGELLSEIIRIRTAEDEAGLGTILEKYLTPVDKSLRDEIRGRLEEAGLPEVIAVVSPQIDLTITKMGKITGVEISYPRSIIAQALDITEKSER